MTSATARPATGSGRNPRRQYVARILESIAPQAGPVAHPALILMAGLPGSGKSTIARRLASGTGATVLESDALRAMLFGAPTHNANESRALFGALHVVAERLIREGRTVIVDATNLRRSDRRPAHVIAVATGVRLVVVHTSAPEAVVLERLRRREAGVDPADRSLAGVSVYRHMAEAVQPITEEHWQIDTSDEGACEGTLRRLIEELRLSGATLPRSQVTGGSIS